MSTGQLCQITWTGSLNGQFFQNVMHGQYEPTGTPDPFIAAVAIGVFAAADWLPLYLDCIPGSVEMSSIRVKMLSPTPGATYTQLDGVAGAVGTRADEFSVDTVGPLLNFPTTLTKQVIGKIFMPGVAEDDIAYGVVDSTLRSALYIFANAIISPGTISGSAAPGTITYCVAKSDHSEWAVPAGAYLSSTIGTQRRRSKPNY